MPEAHFSISSHSFAIISSVILFEAILFTLFISSLDIAMFLYDSIALLLAIQDGDKFSSATLNYFIILSFKFFVYRFIRFLKYLIVFSLFLTLIGSASIKYMVLMIRKLIVNLPLFWIVLPANVTSFLQITLKIAMYDIM